MMWPGANGCEAIFISMKINTRNRGIDIEQHTTVNLSDQETLLPRSNPRSNVETAITRLKAPRKSILPSFDFQCELSTLGKSSPK